MANEATLDTETVIPIPFTVADGTGIEKGTVLTITDPLTASGPALQHARLAGISAEEKIASDGKTKLGVYRGGIFKMNLSGAATVGDALSSYGSNDVGRAPVLTGVSGAYIIGTALETGVDGETILVDVDIQTRGNNA